MSAIPTKAAAAYVGASSVSAFRREVQAGIWPKPITPDSRPQRWSVLQLDAALAGESKETQTDPHLLELEKRLGMA